MSEAESESSSELEASASDASSLFLFSFFFFFGSALQSFLLHPLQLVFPLALPFDFISSSPEEVVSFLAFPLLESPVFLKALRPATQLAQGHLG